jgi:hypothetical protein
MTTTHHGPYLAQDAFFLPIPTDAAEYHRASQGSLRRAVEAQIETLLAFLDFIDVDQDLEQTTSHDDREGDHSDDEPGHDFEQVDGKPVLTAACGRAVLV